MVQPKTVNAQSAQMLSLEGVGGPDKEIYSRHRDALLFLNRFTEAVHMKQVAENRIRDEISYIEKRLEEERKRVEEERVAALMKSLETTIKEKVLCIDESENRALIISKDIVARMPYHQPGGEITWEQCSLRQWLNTTYFESLPPEIKNRIVEVILETPDNSKHGTAGGNDTRDRVFLLSLDEVNRHFKDNKARAAKFKRDWAWWWLRSPGDTSGNAAGVDDDGRVDDRGDYVGRGTGGVRPAFWLKLDS